MNHVLVSLASPFYIYIYIYIYIYAKRERGQYLAILTELAWSIKDLLYGLKSTEKMTFVLVCFRALKRKPVICKIDNAFRFSSSIPTEKSQKSLFTVTENILRKKTFVHPPGPRRNVVAGTKRAIPSGQYRSILPARVANHSAGFGSSCPLAELAIIYIFYLPS